MAKCNKHPCFSFDAAGRTVGGDRQNWRASSAVACDAVFALMICLLALAGCSERGTPADPKQRDENPALVNRPTPVSLDHSEELRDAVLAALAKNDWEGYLALCATESEAEAAWAANDANEEANLPPEKLEAWKKAAPGWLAQRRENFKAAQASWKENFELTVAAFDWKQAKITAFTKRISNNRTGDLFISLNNQIHLKIDDIGKCSAGWRIGERNPLRLRSYADNKEIRTWPLPPPKPPTPVPQPGPAAKDKL